MSLAVDGYKSNRSQKEAIGLICLGTFLEYFDLFLYIHMAVVIDELFFPVTDPQNKNILSAVFFCSTFLFRPLGALLFGYIGDKLGRKFTVIITTTCMGICCLVFATLPTYAQIGITATCIIIVCRAIQGIVSMVEVIGADLYILEITKPPMQYPAVMLVPIAGTLGGVAALAVAYYVTTFGGDWRIAFWFGALVAGTGIIARSHLRETNEFIDAKRRIQKAIVNLGRDPGELKTNVIWNEKVDKRLALSLFVVECGWPVCFYFSFVYCPNILKDVFNLPLNQIIYQNFLVTIIQCIGWSFVAYLSYKINPIKIVKVRLFLFMLFIMFCPFLFGHASSPLHILLIQAIIVNFGMMSMPANPIFYRHFPIFKRFSYTSFIFALSRPAVYIVTSVVMIYFSDILKYWSIVIIALPIAINFLMAVRYFEKIEIDNEEKLEQPPLYSDPAKLNLKVISTAV